MQRYEKVMSLELWFQNWKPKKLQAKSKVEVIRRGLTLLKQSLDRSELKMAYVKAAEAVQKYGSKEVQELDKLSDEGLDWKEFSTGFYT